MTSTPLLRKHLCCKKWGLGENKVASGIGWLYMNDESFFRSFFYPELSQTESLWGNKLHTDIIPIINDYYTDRQFLVWNAASCSKLLNSSQVPKISVPALHLIGIRIKLYLNECTRMLTHKSADLSRQEKEKDRIDRIQLTGLWMALV